MENNKAGEHTQGEWRVEEHIEEDGLPKYDIMQGDVCYGSFITKFNAYAELGRIVEKGTLVTVNRDKEKIEKRIKEIKNDERLTYKSATVFSNAPLALIQLQLSSELNALEWALGLPQSKMPLPKKEAIKQAKGE